MNDVEKSSSKFKLTPSQQEFASQNHNLIYAFIRDRHLPVNDMYDWLALQYCKAVASYDPNFGDGNVSFSSYLYMILDRSLQLHWKFQHRLKRVSNVDAVSLDALRCVSVDSEDEPLDLYNLVSTDDEDTIDFDLLLEDVYKVIQNEEDRFIIRSRLLGYTQEEISFVLGWNNQSEISNRLKVLREFLAVNEIIPKSSEDIF